MGYGALLLAGGAAGYAKRRSVKSLAASGGAAAALALAAGTVGLQSTAGLSACCSVGVALALLMGSRFASSKKFMPAGLVSLASAVYVVGMLTL